MIVILYFLKFGITAVDNIFAKKLQTSMKMTLSKALYLNFLNALFALFFYLIDLSFKLSFQPLIIFCSLIYAIFCFFAVTQNIYLLEYISIAMYSIMSISGALVGSTLFSVIAMKEKLTVKLILAILAILLSVILPMLEVKDVKKTQNFKNILIYIYLFLFCALSSSMGTLYLILPMDPLQYYAQTNLILVIVCFLMLIFTTKKKYLKNIFNIFSAKQLGILVGRSGISFVSTLLTIEILALISVAINSIMSNAIALVAAMLVSILFCRQKTSLMQIISLIFIIIATALCSL